MLIHLTKAGRCNARVADFKASDDRPEPYQLIRATIHQIDGQRRILSCGAESDTIGRVLLSGESAHQEAVYV